jgi:hypothetical protein
MTLPEAQPRPLLAGLRASLYAKLERTLRRPIIAAVVTRGKLDVQPLDDSGEIFGDNDCDGPGLDLFRAFADSAAAIAPAHGALRSIRTFQEAPEDGGVRVQIQLDYADRWRGREREVLEAVEGTIEGTVALLTEEQKVLLERSPREFLALMPRPEQAELVSYSKEHLGGAEQVTALILAEGPRGAAAVRYVAIVPNLTPLERQLEALAVLEAEAPEGPLAALRVLLGLEHVSCLPAADPAALVGPAPMSGTRLDLHQAACVQQALCTPHFAVIKGPPGSGKTTVITEVVEAALRRGEKVLVVSPTHVAVDNVVEKLAAASTGSGPQELRLSSLPVRFAARDRKLLPAARAYWVGPKRQARAATVAKRVEHAISKALPLGKSIFGKVTPELAGFAALSVAVDQARVVICGTPIGILSYDPVKTAAPGSFDLLIVDEVSKMTLPEFLATAVKARRWVLVGDPDQLPPFNNIEENGDTLDDVISSELELVCSVGAILDRIPPRLRSGARLVVVAADPARAAEALVAHLAEVQLIFAPPVRLVGQGMGPGVVLCRPTELAQASAQASPVFGRDRTFNPNDQGGLQVLVQRGLAVARPAFASGLRFVEPRQRAVASLFETVHNVYHAQPWALRAKQKVFAVQFRNGLEKLLPSVAALVALGEEPSQAEEARAALIDAIAERYALNAVSVYDWLTGMPVEAFDTAPMTELGDLVAAFAPLRAAVEPYVGTLRKQYRMHPSLSMVPRELFYFGEALEDGVRHADQSCRVRLHQVEGDSQPGESSRVEANAICAIVAGIEEKLGRGGHRPSVLVITPYREQERLLGEVLAFAEQRGQLSAVSFEVCTLDRCQGREADFVFISLVRSKATVFLDAPKRWNVALTRAKQGLFIVGDINAYLAQAEQAQDELRKRPPGDRPMISIPARFLSAYHHQISAEQPLRARS